MLVIPPDSVMPALLGVGGVLAASLVIALLRSKTRKVSDIDESGLRPLHTLEKNHWLLGDLPEFGEHADHMHDWMTEKALHFNGEPWRVQIAPILSNMNVFTDPAHIEDITVNFFDNFGRGERQTRIVEDLFGRSMPATDGERWYHQRKASVRFFTAKALRLCMTSFMRKNMLQMYNLVDKSIETGKPIEMIKFFSDFAMQTFSELGLGVDLKLIETSEQHPLDHVFEHVTPTLIRRSVLPTYWWRLERFLGIGREGNVTREMKEVRRWISNVLEESLAAARIRQADRESGKLEGTETAEIKTVIELFLEQSAEDKDGMRAEDLVEFILTFLLAARGSSATSLQWIFLIIAKYPDVERRLREEMAAIFPESDETTYFTAEDAQKLVYLEATIREALRLFPPVPLNQREALKDTVIGGKYLVKKGELVSISPFVMARLPSLWGPDATEFKPERWIDPATGGLITVPSTKFTTFSTGPRNCIGMKLAMLELRVATLNLINRYKFELAVPNDLSYVVSIELMTKTPVMMTPTKIIKPKTATATAA